MFSLNFMRERRACSCPGTMLPEGCSVSSRAIMPRSPEEGVLWDVCLLFTSPCAFVVSASAACRGLAPRSPERVRGSSCFPFQPAAILHLRLHSLTQPSDDDRTGQRFFTYVARLCGRRLPRPDCNRGLVFGARMGAR